jgi:hypothetical protein
MLTLADRLNAADTGLDNVEEEVTELLCALGVWDNIDDWDYDSYENALSFHLVPLAPPELTPQQQAGLRKAGFGRVYFDGYSPAAGIDLVRLYDTLH